METRKIQEKIMELVKVFNEVCCENNIEYTLAAGSVLGAVRHNGFIPWDCDMDVLVPLEQFDLLRKKILEKITNTNMKLYMWDKEEKYYEVLDRLCFDGIPHEELHLDIFPLIGAPSGKIRRYVFTNTIYYTYRILRCKYCNTDYSKPNHVKKIKFIRNFVKIIPDKIIIKWYKFLERKYDLRKAEYSYMLGSGYGYKEAMRKTVYLNTMKEKFEDMELNIPKDYKFYLIQLYGEDYMTPKKDGYKKIDKKLKK